MKIEIRSAPADVQPWLQSVREHADSERHSLGFLPHAAYAEAAAKGNVYLALAISEQGTQYAGHLLIGRRFPHARISQLYVAPESRRQGVADILIRWLVADCERYQFLTITARVAKDLPANAFWQAMRFHPVREEAGGATTGRLIVVRQRVLNTPTLFTSANRSARQKAPVFAIDVNVLLDLAKDRPRSESARRVVLAGLSGMVQLFVAAEFVAELDRAAVNSGEDVVVRLARSIPQFPKPQEGLIDSLLAELESLVFPARVGTGLRRRDVSDLLHLATSIHCKASGFITSDSTILGKAEEIRLRYGVEILATTEFDSLYFPATVADLSIEAASVLGEVGLRELSDGTREDATAFLIAESISPDQATAILDPGFAESPRRRFGVTHAGRFIGVATWDPARGARPVVQGWICVVRAHPMTELACELLLEAMSRDACADRPARIRLNCQKYNLDVVHCILMAGFVHSGTADATMEFGRCCIGGVILLSEWEAWRELLARSIEVNLPSRAPAFPGSNERIETLFSGQPLRIGIDEAETTMGPVLFALRDRPMALVPIRREFADELLRTGSQRSLLQVPEAAGRPARQYFSDARTGPALQPGTLVLFYESLSAGRGRGAVVAAARIVRGAMRPKDAIGASDIRGGVLTPAQIAGIGSAAQVWVSFFDQVLVFSKPVPLGRLRQLGCVDGSNLVTARRIDDTAGSVILHEGAPRASW